VVESVDYVNKSQKHIKKGVVMKSVKKYYLIPENRYKLLTERGDVSLCSTSKPVVEEDPSERFQNSSAEEQSPKEHKDDSVVPLKDAIEEYPLKRSLDDKEGASFQQVTIPLSPTLSTHSSSNWKNKGQIGGEKLKRKLPPPGLPVKYKRKRNISWISL
jgi:hypothetical protein